jgi:hypothetical protein
MRFTQAQLREAVGLSVETYRHWRSVLPPLTSHKGRAAHFTFGDLVALGVIRRVVEELGVGVSSIALASANLFAECRGEPWLASERRYAVFSLPFRSDPQSPMEGLVDVSGTLVDDGDLVQVVAAGAIIIPMEPIVTALRTKLLDNEIADARRQPPLPFGPTRLTRSSA